ncbi:anti-sigma factor [Mycetocola sp.]|jgi:anti-sigma-K factor RskA|uniref:anti-sigma factor n=1 Tax=Mycetocola sp. TaxID=1871042 RepID=UPI002613CAB5|nr:anti-sigma factor [Mycetocola sp.]MCU1560845.1 Anti-sigma-K factor rskA [Mycetocola sp.]
MTENRDPAELAGAYALDALNAEEKAEYERHLATSVDARREAESLGEAAALLGFDAEPVEPSAALRASVLASIASTPQLRRLDSAGTDAATSAANPAPIASTDAGAPEAQPVRPTSAPAAAPTTKAATARPASAAQRKANRRWYSQPLSAAVAAAALVAVLLGVNGLTSALNNGNGLPEALQLAHINAQPDAQRETVKLTNINDDKRVVATLVWSGELGQSALIVDGLASLSEEETYELWYIREEGPISAGTFNTTGGGDSWRILGGTMAAGDAVGVTVEPAGGSEQPTTDPLIVIHTA